MEYFLLFMAILYLVYFIFCINFFRREPGLKSHEKAYWIFLSLAFPLIIPGLYRSLHKRQRDSHHSPNRVS
jgi:hypothetical protein